jgi:hypothetical protein
MEHLKITNPARYKETVLDIDTSGLHGHRGADGNRTHYTGTLEIQTAGGWRTWTGEHGLYDYEEEYGFILKQEEG